MSENDDNSGGDQSTYETPTAPSEEAGTPSGPELAGRGRRLGAYIIDTIIAGIVLVAVAYFNPGPLGITMLDIVRDPMTQQMSTAGSIAFVIIFMAINSYLLLTKGADSRQIGARHPHRGRCVKRCRNGGQIIGAPLRPRDACGGHSDHWRPSWGGRLSVYLSRRSALCPRSHCWHEGGLQSVTRPTQT